MIRMVHVPVASSRTTILNEVDDTVPRMSVPLCSERTPVGDVRVMVGRANPGWNPFLFTVSCGDDGLAVGGLGEMPPIAGGGAVGAFTVKVNAADGWPPGLVTRRLHVPVAFNGASI